MGYFLERLSLAIFRLLGRLLARHLRSWQAAWSSAWHGPRLEIRLLGLSTGIVITWVLVPVAFNDLGLVRGASYFIAVYLAMSNATFFKIAKVGRDRYIPLGVVAPVFILGGVIGSSAVRPLLGDAKDAAMAQDFIGALVILGVFAVMTRWLRLWQSGSPY